MDSNRAGAAEESSVGKVPRAPPDRGGPLVSVGVPVCNGGGQLAYALDSIVNQTYPNLEIIVSDNGSTDETPEICRRFARRDPRIRIFRQEKVLSMVENFRFVFEQSRGPYFMWAAHDDLRTENYVEVLLPALEKDPSAVLAFSDVAIFQDHRSYRESRILPHRFDTRGLSTLGKLMRRDAIYAPLHFYGLIRAESLRAYPWIPPGDSECLSFLLALGDFVYVPGAVFYCWRRPRGSGRSYDGVWTRPRRRRKLAVHWSNATAFVEGSRHSGRAPSRSAVFLALWANYLRRSIGRKVRSLRRWLRGEPKDAWR